MVISRKCHLALSSTNHWEKPGLVGKAICIPAFTASLTERVLKSMGVSVGAKLHNDTKIIDERGHFKNQ